MRVLMVTNDPSDTEAATVSARSLWSKRDILGNLARDLVSRLEKAVPVAS